MTASTIHAVLDETHRTGPREIRLIPTQNAIVNPPLRFETTKVR